MALCTSERPGDRRGAVAYFLSAIHAQEIDSERHADDEQRDHLCDAAGSLSNGAIVVAETQQFGHMHADDAALTGDEKPQRQRRKWNVAVSRPGNDCKHRRMDEQPMRLANLTAAHSRA